MTRRQTKAARRAEARRLADRDRLDDALAPYLRTDGRADGGPVDVLELHPADLVDEPVYVTVRVAEGATIDLRRQPGRTSVVRLHRRPPVALAG